MKRGKWNSRLILRSLVVACSICGFSQMVSATPQQAETQIAVQGPIDNQVFVQGGQVAIAGPPIEIGFESFGPFVPGKTVKGAPYSAVASTETTQTLSDGNQINHKMTSNVYRDSQGRTRREENFSGIGMLAINGKQAHSVVFISDPVSGSDYILEPENKIARKMPSLSANGITTNKVFTMGATMGVAVRTAGDAGAPGAQVAGHSEALSLRTSEDSGVQITPESESLGQQTIEGVVADGKRITMTIPAGAMGNERPITTMTEEWFSRELQVVVLRTTNDPRMGETTYRLTNIQRTEPAATLFTLPADYTVKDFEKPMLSPRPAQANE